MSQGGDAPDPSRVHTMAELAHALTTLRRRVARKGQVQLSVRDLATRTGRAASTLHPYLRGDRLCPQDVYESLLRALGVDERQLRAWLDAWDRIADNWHRNGAEASPVPAPVPVPRRAALLSHSETLLYRIGTRRRVAKIGIITGDIRSVKSADVWVNSENTGMQMARFEEYSTSAIIRFEGAVQDQAGRVVDDRIAIHLAERLAGRTPVAPGTAVTTTAGELTRRNNVLHVIHVAAVSGEPGSGYRQIRDVGRCVTNALVEAERLGTDDLPVRTILFPILGVGVGVGDLEPTVRALLNAAADHVSTWPNSRLGTVYLLASTAEELAVCRTVFDTDPRLNRVPTRG